MIGKLLKPNSGDRRVGVALAAIIATAVGVTIYAFRPIPPRPPIDTKRESGDHLAFVLVAPTATADTGYIRLVRLARDSMRALATRRGIFFTTVGVSDAWDVENGLRILRKFGWFDELILGRNWFNSGIQKYINDFNATPGVPQVVLTQQHIAIDSLPFAYGPIHVLARAVGEGRLLEWERAGFPVRSDKAPP
jgi:hypothetical protein